MTKKIFRLDKESEIYQFWETFGLFRANPTSSKKPYSVLIPPPNLTGELHLGHAMQHSILDAVARFKRLQGFDVLLLPGVDHAGILFEATLDRELEKENLSKEKLGREEWLKKAWQFKEKIYKSVSSTWRFMGLSADWDREVFTLDAGPQKAVFEEFKTYFENGLIYKGPYIVQWCPKCNTAIEDVEMEYEEKEETLYYVRYLIEGTKDEYIEIATARPETIFADSGIAVYPNHSKFKKNVVQADNFINNYGGNREGFFNLGILLQVCQVKIFVHGIISFQFGMIAVVFSVRQNNFIFTGNGFASCRACFASTWQNFIFNFSF